MLHLLALTGSTHGSSIGASLSASAIQSVGLPPEESQRIGVYVLAGIVGLLVTGILACAAELRRDLADRKLRNAESQQVAASIALQALARSMHSRAA